MTIKKYVLMTASYIALATSPFWITGLRKMSLEYQRNHGYFFPKVEVEQRVWSETVKLDYDHDGLIDASFLRIPLCPIKIPIDKKTIESKLSE